MFPAPPIAAYHTVSDPLMTNILQICNLAPLQMITHGEKAPAKILNGLDSPPP
jgi:hypothetical protein